MVPAMARHRISIVALIAAFLFGTLNAATMSTAMAMGSLVVANDSATRDVQRRPLVLRACVGDSASISPSSI